MTRSLFYGRCASQIALTCCIGLFPATIVLAQSERPAEERIQKITLDRGYLSVSAQNVPLQDVLTAIGEAGGFEIEWHGTDAQQRISARFEARPLTDGLNELLSGRNYLLLQKGRGRDRQITKIVVGLGATGTSSGSTVAPPPVAANTAPEYREREIPESPPPRQELDDRRAREIPDQPGGTGPPPLTPPSAPSSNSSTATTPIQPSSPFPYLNAIQQQNRARQLQEKASAPPPAQEAQ